MEIISLLVWLACGFACYKLAEKQGRNTVLAAVFGVIFGLLAVLVYLIIGNKKQLKLINCCLEGLLFDIPLFLKISIFVLPLFIVLTLKLIQL